MRRTLSLLLLLCFCLQAFAQWESGLRVHEGVLRADLHTAADLPQRELSPEQRRNIFLLIKEALHNTVKHAEASSVRIAFAWQDGLSITLHDDGRGLPPKAEGSGRGLTNMRSRAQALGGHIAFCGEAGTRISVQVPFA